MEREQGRGNTERAPRGPGARRGRARWAAPLSLLLLVAGTAALAASSAKPIAFSVLDALVLVAVAVLAGTYVILAREDQERTVAGKDQRNPPTLESGTGSPPGGPSGGGSEKRPWGP